MKMQKKKVLYIKTPKTASTFIAEWLRKNGNVNVFTEPLMGGMLARQPSDRERRWEVIKNTNYDMKLVSVRNPFTRTVSAYRWLLQNSARPSRGLPWIKNRKDSILGFKSFLKKPLPELYKENYYTWQICLPVYDYARCDSFSYDYIIRLESLMKNLNEVAPAHQTKKLPKMESSGEYNFKDYYDEENKDLVIKKYNKDFEYFSYKKNLL